MELKKIILRADGNSNIGLGHLYRIFALAEIYSNNYECIFVTKCSSELSIFPKGYKLILIPNQVSTKDEPKWLNNFFNSNKFLIILDGYHFNYNYQINLKKIGFNILLIDDFVEKNIAADVVVNHALSIKIKDFGLLKKMKFGLGPKYAMLRQIFFKEAQKNKTAKPLRKVFLCFGGADFNNLTDKCLKSLIDIECFEEIHVILGNAYKQKDIYTTINDCEKKVFLHKNLNEIEMLKIMSKCDFAVLPSSTIIYEACAVNMIIFGGYYIENQLKIYNGLKNHNMIYDAGDFNLINEDDLTNKINCIVADSKDNYQKKLDNQNRFFDGKQKERFLNLTKELLC